MLVAVLFAWLLPKSLAWVLRAAKLDGLRVRVAAGVPLVVGGALLGLRMLGPVVVNAPYGVASWAALVGVAAFTAAMWIRATKEEKNPATDNAVAVFTAVLIGGLGFAVPVASDVLTRRPESAEAGWWRMRFVPWDGDALMEVAWSARHRDDLRVAELRLELARRADAAEWEALQLQAELFAAAGACEEARATFDLSQRARAEEALLRNESLQLGGWALLPALVGECGVRPPEELLDFE